MTRDEDAASFVAETVEEGDHPAPLHRVEAGQRLVEDQDLGVVDECTGDLHPLPHALRELPDRLRSGVGQFDLVECPGRRRSGIGHAVTPRRDRDHLEGIEVIEQCVLLRDERDPAADVTIDARIGAQHPDRAA